MEDVNFNTNENVQPILEALGALEKLSLPPEAFPLLESIRSVCEGVKQEDALIDVSKIAGRVYAIVADIVFENGEPTLQEHVAKSSLHKNFDASIANVFQGSFTQPVIDRSDTEKELAIVEKIAAVLLIRSGGEILVVPAQSRLLDEA